MTNIIIKSLNDKLEEYFIEGLRLKGFEFKSKVELEEFIKSNCGCEDYADIKQRTYFVNNVPFFFTTTILFTNRLTFQNLMR